MAAVAALKPVNAAEGRVAAQFVAADAWAMDCLRLAQVKRREPDIAQKCRAQAMGMMREAKSALRVLLRMQAARQAMQRDEEAANRAAWAEHSALGMMGEALGGASAGTETELSAGEVAVAGAEVGMAEGEVAEAGSTVVAGVGPGGDDFGGGAAIVDGGDESPANLGVTGWWFRGLALGGSHVMGRRLVKRGLRRRRDVGRLLDVGCRGWPVAVGACVGGLRCAYPPYEA